MLTSYIHILGIIIVVSLACAAVRISADSHQRLMDLMMRIDILEKELEEHLRAKEERKDE